MVLHPAFEKGIRLGFLISQMERIDQGELFSRAAVLPEELRRTFETLHTTYDPDRLLFDVSVEEVFRLTAAVLEIPEEEQKKYRELLEQQ